jgi:hypothetical protein
MSVIMFFQVEVLMLSNLLALQTQIARPAASGFIALSIVPHQRRSSAGVIQARGSVFKGGKESISHNLYVVLRVPCGCSNIPNFDYDWLVPMDHLSSHVFPCVGSLMEMHGVSLQGGFPSYGSCLRNSPHELCYVPN